jgi:hypothetical protein
LTRVRHSRRRRSAAAIGVAATLLLAGCATTPPPKAPGIIESDANAMARCQFLGTVQGASMIGGTMTPAIANATADAKDKAAAMGATHYVMGAAHAGSTESFGSAQIRAYRCD